MEILNRDLLEAHQYTINSLQEVNASLKAETGQLLNEKVDLFSKTNRMSEERDQLIKERHKLKNGRKLLRAERNPLRWRWQQTQDSSVEVNA